MENLFDPLDVLTYNQLMEWDKNELASFILSCTYIRYAKDSYDNNDLPMDKLIATI